jgi:Leucine-rich repeat (LRR) protein
MKNIWNRLFGRNKEHKRTEEHLEEDQEQEVVKNAFCFKRIPLSNIDPELLQEMIPHLISTGEEYLDYLYLLSKQDDPTAAYMLWELEQLSVLAYPEIDSDPNSPLAKLKSLFHESYLDLRALELNRYPKAMDWLEFRYICFNKDAFSLAKKTEVYVFENFNNCILNRVDYALIAEDLNWLWNLEQLSPLEFLYVLKIDLGRLFPYLLPQKGQEKQLQSFLEPAFLYKFLLDKSVIRTFKRSDLDLVNNQTKLEIEGKRDLASTNCFAYEDIYYYAYEGIKELKISDFAKVDAKQLLRIGLECYDLEYLSVSYSDLDCIPFSQFSNLDRVQYLDLRYLPKLDTNTLFKWVSKMESLKSLGLSNVDIQPLEEGLEACLTLRNLELSFIQRTVHPKLSGLAKIFPNIEELTLPAFDYYDVISKDVPRFKKLKRLNYALNEFRDVEHQFTQLANLPIQELGIDGYETNFESLSQPFLNLKSLYLDRNYKLDLESLCAKGKHFPKLERLVLASCKLKQIPQSIANFENLQELVLAWNNDLDIQQTLVHLKALPKLKLLDLSDCDISFIPWELLEFEALEVLYIGGNYNLDFKKLKSLFQGKIEHYGFQIYNTRFRYSS